MGDSVNSQLMAYKQLLGVTTNYHAEGGDGEVHFKPLSEKDKEFIEGALKETVEKTDPVKVLEKTLESLKEAEDKETKLMLIEDLVDLLGQIDLATIYVKNYHGLEDIKNGIINGDDTEIKGSYISLLTTVTHNNIDVQDLINDFSKEFNFLEYFLENYVESSTLAHKLRMRSLGAISAIVSHHTNNFTTFISLNGVGKLKNLLKNVKKNTELVERVKFSINSLKSTIPELSEDCKNKYASELSYLQ
uniref:Fes1 domain-containing protein n=1 Tax=Strongyloides papillosus TaxID=174720 RepID=A0A0N5B5T4_STREA